MTEPTPTGIRPVPGEMRPWSDLDGAPGPLRGPVTLRWLSAVLPRGGRWLVVGAHSPEVLALATERADRLTVLLRSQSDAQSVRQSMPDEVDLVAGALDGFGAGDEGVHDVVLAADGLDRVLTPDSAELSWPQRWELLDALAADDALIVLGLENELSVATLLDARVARDRHGDEEWRPLHSDPDRPCSLAQLTAAVTETGRTVEAAWAAYGPVTAPLLLVRDTVAEAARGQHLVTALAGAAARASDTPLLAGPDEAVATAARAGALGGVAAGFVVVLGGSPTSGVPDVLVEDGEEAIELAADVATRETVESVLRSLAEREDVPAFRSAARGLGAWLRQRPDASTPIRFDRTVRDGDTWTEPLRAPRPDGDVTPEAAWAGAWMRFQDRLLREHRRHPWPPWVLGEPLVELWSSMAEVEVGAEDLARGRVLADELADPEPTVVDSRTALADAAEAEKQLFEARGHIAGLERTIGFRDKQLQTREDRIRALHEDVVMLDTIRNHPAYRTARKNLKRATKLRDPKAFAAAAKKKAGQELRRRR